MSKFLRDLKQQLITLETKLVELQECSLRASAKHNLEMQNAQICIKEVETKVAEEEKSFKFKICRLCEQEFMQDKISFAVEQLNQIKKFYNEYNNSDTHTTYEVLYQLDRQIKQLKEMK